MDDQDDIMKCECGHIMRRYDWNWHWAECSIASTTTVSRLDRKRLLANEKQRG